VEHRDKETVRAGKLVPATALNTPGILDGSGACTRVLYVSESQFGIRVRHRYDRVLNGHIRENIPAESRQWDRDAKTWIFRDDEHLAGLFRLAKRRGWSIAVDDGAADTRRPVGVPSTWADTLGGYIDQDHRPEVMVEILAVLEKYEAAGVRGADKAARHIRAYTSWAC
jgi:hypothetical protein